METDMVIAILVNMLQLKAIKMPGDIENTLAKRLCKQL